MAPSTTYLPGSDVAAGDVLERRRTAELAPVESAGSVSGVIPCRRGGPYVREAVRSFLDQTVPPDEIVVVSDGCPDDLSDLEEMDPRVRVLRQPHRGVSVARNVGVAAARGEFIAFLDEDDLSRPHRIEWELEALRAAPDAALCFGRYRLADADGHPTSEAMGEAVGQREILEFTFPLICSLLARRSALLAAGGFDPTLGTCEDIDLYLRVLIDHDATFVPEVLFDYRRHGQNAKLGTWDLVPVFEKYRDWARRIGRHDLAGSAELGLRRVRRNASRAAFDTARGARRRGDVVGAARWFAVCAAREPGFLAGVAWSRVRRRPDLSPEGHRPA